MFSRVKLWSSVFLLSLALTGPARAGYLQINGPEASYNSATDIFSVSGNAIIGSRSICCDPIQGSGFQTLIALIDQDGVLLSGNYSLFGTIPIVGINAPTLLISARVAGVSLFAAPYDTSNPSAGGTLSMQILFDNIFVDPLLDADVFLGGWGPTAHYCCSVYTRGGTNTGVATPQTPWVGSWSGYFASDYSDISSRPLSEPNMLMLVCLGLICNAMVKNLKSVANANLLNSLA